MAELEILFRRMRVDAGHLDGLLVLGQHILQQILVILVIVEDLHALDAERLEGAARRAHRRRLDGEGRLDLARQL